MSNTNNISKNVSASVKANDRSSKTNIKWMILKENAHMEEIATYLESQNNDLDLVIALMVNTVDKASFHADLYLNSNQGSPTSNFPYLIKSRITSYYENQYQKNKHLSLQAYSDLILITSFLEQTVNKIKSLPPLDNDQHIKEAITMYLLEVQNLVQHTHNKSVTAAYNNKRFNSSNDDKPKLSLRRN